MIVIQRKNGDLLNLASAIFLKDFPEGIAAEFPNGTVYLVSQMSLSELFQYTEGRSATIITIPCDFFDLVDGGKMLREAQGSEEALARAELRAEIEELKRQLELPPTTIEEEQL